MLKKYLLVVGNFVAISVMVSVSGGQQLTNKVQSASQCPAGDTATHALLLEYAALAEMAYESFPGPRPLDPYRYCPDSVHVPGLEPRLVTPVAVREDIVRRGVQMVLRQSEGSLEEKYFISLTNSKDDPDTTYIMCRSKQTITDRFAIAFRYIHDDANNRLSLEARAVILVAASEVDEELRLKSIGFWTTDKTPSREELLGIQGTDVLHLPHWKASIEHLIDNACVFDLAVGVAVEFFDSFQVPDIYVPAIVGHSLGGAVAQHVTIEAGIPAYSFNSIGVDAANVSEMKKTVDLYRTHFRSKGISDREADYLGMQHHLYRKYLFMRGATSVRIAGELLESNEEGFKTTQIGAQYRYGLPEPPTPTKLEHRIKRHGIETVQEHICLCIGGDGQF